MIYTNNFRSQQKSKHDAFEQNYVHLYILFYAYIIQIW